MNTHRMRKHAGAARTTVTHNSASDLWYAVNVARAAVRIGSAGIIEATFTQLWKPSFELHETTGVRMPITSPLTHCSAMAKPIGTYSNAFSSTMACHLAPTRNACLHNGLNQTRCHSLVKTPNLCANVLKTACAF